MSFLRETLDNIAPTFTSERRKRHSYIIVGKPGSGKTTLAEKLSKMTETQLINSEYIVGNIQATSMDQKILQVESELRKGYSITAKNIIESFYESKNAQFQGFIIDGIPMMADVPDFDSQLDNLVRVSQDYGDCVLIDLRISNQDLIRRRAGIWLDPLTNVRYPSQQVLYSRQRRQEGWMEGEEDMVLKEELVEQIYKFPEELKEEEEVYENEDENDGEAAIDKQKKSTAHSLKNRKAYPILSEKVLDRLVKEPENDPDMVQRDLDFFGLVESRLETIKKRYFGILNVIELDATQHPDVVFAQLKVRLHARGFSVYHPLIQPSKLNLPEGGLKGIAETELLKFLNQTLVEGEPEREFSGFGKYCPVSLKDDNRLSISNTEFAVNYRGKIYFFVSELYQSRFLTNPDYYISENNTRPPANIWIIGGPISGKTTISETLALKYNLAYISIDYLLTELIELPEEQKTEFQNAIVEKLKSGASISNDHYVHLISSRISKTLETHRGWILDGFPVSIDQCQKLLEANIVPNKVYTTTAEYTNPVVSSILNTSTDLPFSTPILSLIPFHDEMIKVFNTEMHEVTSFLSSKSIEIQNFIWKGDSLITVNEILSNYDPFVPRALPVSRSFESTPMLGKTKDYCPVLLHNEGRLRKGDIAFSAKFQGMYYQFCSEEARNLFCSKPYYFLKNVAIPPPRLIILGPSGSGISSLSQKLGAKWNVPVIDFFTYLQEFKKIASKEIKEEITSVLQGIGILQADTIKKIFHRLFSSEPYSTQGFFLKRFPVNKSDLEVLIKNQLLPDAFVFLRAETDVATMRKLKSKRSETVFLEKHRVEMLNSSPSAENNSLLVSDEKILEDLASKYEAECFIYSEYQSMLESSGLVPVFNVNTSKCFRPVEADLNAQLAPLLKHRNSLFYNVYKIPSKKAKNFISFGVKNFSKFGKYCPVLLESTKKVNLMNFGDIPVLMGDEIYFLKGKTSLQEFERNPASYITQKPPKPQLSTTACIVGNEKSGKTTLSKSLCDDLDTFHLTVSYILQSVLDEGVATSLKEQIEGHLIQGETVPDQLVVDAIVLMTNRLIAAGKGWILDGYPTTLKQAKLLEAAGFQPHIFLQLQLDKNLIETRVQQDADEESVNARTPSLNHCDLILERNQVIEKNIDDIRDLFNSRYSNWIQINGNNSKWLLKHETVELCEGALERRQKYLDLKSQEKAAPVADIGLSNAFILSNMSCFLGYCPVSLMDLQELVVSPKSTEFVVEYKDKFYYLSNQKTMEQFLKSPQKYTAGTLPSKLPIKKPKTELKSLFPKTISFKGYCPVTYFDEPSGFESIVPGSHDFIVEYDSKIFAFVDEDKLQRFMRTPWKFENQTLPVKLPPPVAPIPVLGLPVVGYLEQTVAKSLTNALYNVGQQKPKYPFKSIEDSAKEYISLHLRANNPKSKEWVKKSYSKKLLDFQRNCTLLTSLTNVCSKIDPEKKNDDIDAKLTKFLQMAAQIE